MFSIALTGNVASGKSTVLAHFARWGATVIDADALVREVQTPGSPVLVAIRERFGTDVILPDGSLDRALLRRLVMSNHEERSALNAIVHPEVERRRRALAQHARNRGDLVVISDIPLLFEVLNQADFDAVILMDATSDERARRLVEERGLTAEDAQHLLDAQIPAERKRPRSDFIIDNDGTLPDLEHSAWKVWLSVRERAASSRVPSGTRIHSVLSNPIHVLWMSGALARYASTTAHVTLELPDDPAARGQADHLQALLGLDAVRFGPGDPAREQTDVLLTDAAGSGNARRVCEVIPPGVTREDAVPLDVRPWKDVRTRVHEMFGVLLEDSSDHERFACRPPVSSLDLGLVEPRSNPS